jgi:hypothetical protein
MAATYNIPEAVGEKRATGINSIVISIINMTTYPYVIHFMFQYILPEKNITNIY